MRPAWEGRGVLRAEMIGQLCSGTVDTESHCSGSDTGLVARLRAGEQEAYEQLVRQHGPGIYRLSCRLLGDAEEARDVTQETFIKVFRYVGRLREDDGFTKWLYRIAINQACNRLRFWRRRRRGDTSSLSVTGTEGEFSWAERIRSCGADPEENLLAKESEELMLRALGRVKACFRITLIMRDIEGFSYEEISDVLAISPGTVKSRIARGRASLKNEMERLGWRSSPRASNQTRKSLEWARR